MERGQGEHYSTTDTLGRTSFPGLRSEQPGTGPEPGAALRWAGWQRPHFSLLSVSDRSAPVSRAPSPSAEAEADGQPRSVRRGPAPTPALIALPTRPSGAGLEAGDSVIAARGLTLARPEATPSRPTQRWGEGRPPAGSHPEGPAPGLEPLGALLRLELDPSLPKCASIRSLHIRG
uniref:Uncharacterized protein n=1 Tax=Rangifer tarandus platyrhynchus TaxID=3082113 RepID=A0ACB0DXV2_RANTA|nr:unnamed protein product [Rangifer tarandus platyrhynchus]